MTKWLKPIEIANAIILLLLGIGIFSALNNLQYDSLVDGETKPYQLAIVTDEVQSFAYENFILGINRFSQRDDLAIEIYNTEELDSQAIFEMIALTRVDGVVIKLSDNSAVRIEIEHLIESGIKVIVVGNDIPESNRNAFVGSNKYQMGKETGYLVAAAAAENGHVAVIFGSDYKDESTIATRNYLSGFRESLEQNEATSLQSVQFTVQDRAETIVGQLLNLESIPDVIVCTDPLDVSRVIRVLVDRNLVGSVKVIGSGSTLDVLEWIDKDVIYASVVESHDIIGELAASTLYQFLVSEKGSAYVNVPFDVLTKQGGKKDLQR